MTLKHEPHTIHHVNFPTMDRERTQAWYGRVFSMEAVELTTHLDANWTPENAVLLMTRGNFDLYHADRDW